MIIYLFQVHEKEALPWWKRLLGQTNILQANKENGPYPLITYTYCSLINNNKFNHAFNMIFAAK